MARKPVNKSAVIRELLTANPKARPRDVVVMLAERGIQSSPNLVHLVRAKMSGTARRQRKAAAVANGSPLDLIRSVHQCAQQAGGYAALRELVDLLAGQPG